MVSRSEGSGERDGFGGMCLVRGEEWWVVEGFGGVQYEVDSSWRYKC